MIVDSMKEYARRWARNKNVDLDTLSKCIKYMEITLEKDRSSTVFCLHQAPVPFCDPGVTKEISHLYEKYIKIAYHQ